MHARLLLLSILYLTFPCLISAQGNFEIDSTIKLCRFKNDKEYAGFYGKRPHFYLNDSEKKFLNCKQISFAGVDFSCMMLINPTEVSKGEYILNKHMPLLSGRVNGMEVYSAIDLGNKKVLHAAKISVDSYKSLENYPWITVRDYVLDARTIPAIIKSRKLEDKEGLGLLFIVEKFSKQDKTISGYWVVFDFNDRKTLLIDYIKFNSVGAGSSNYGWVSYWETALLESGIYMPISFQRYLELARKGDVELICD